MFGTPDGGEDSFISRSLITSANVTEYKFTIHPYVRANLLCSLIGCVHLGPNIVGPSSFRVPQRPQLLSKPTTVLEVSKPRRVYWEAQ